VNSEELDHDKVIRLEERLAASEKALELALKTVQLATNSSQILVSQILSISAVLVSGYAIFHK
jgi:hypothetical protein